jgi:hypothetical protein
VHGPVRGVRSRYGCHRISSRDRFCLTNIIGTQCRSGSCAKRWTRESLQRRWRSPPRQSGGHVSAQLLAASADHARRAHAEISPAQSRLDARADSTRSPGAAEIILRSRPHPEQGFRSCIGILGLAKRYDPERVDDACAQAHAPTARSRCRSCEYACLRCAARSSQLCTVPRSCRRADHAQCAARWASCSELEKMKE